jgi:hypothetical protein
VVQNVPPDEPAVPLEVARVEAAARAVRLDTVVVPLWKAARAWTVAFVLAAFPFLFMVDDGVAFPLSPVLPGLAILAVVIVILPFLLVEVRSRRYRRKDAHWQEVHALRAVGVARAALGLAAVWLLAWFMVGT